MVLECFRVLGFKGVRFYDATGQCVPRRLHPEPGVLKQATYGGY